MKDTILRPLLAAVSLKNDMEWASPKNRIHHLCITLRKNCKKFSNNA